MKESVSSGSRHRERTWHGLLLIDKVKGITSHDVVNEVRRVLGQKSVGHAGTLDPMATGLMVLLLGEATKLSDFLRLNEKAYQLRVQLGLQTDSWDADGEVLEQKAVSLDPVFIVQAAKQLSGPLQLPVPLFSAVKRQGRKLYEYGRRGDEIELPVREMTFFNVDIDEVGKDFLQAHLACSKGSYIRSWANELGEKLKTGATLVALRRTASLPYRLEQAITVEELKRFCHQGQPQDQKERGSLPAFVPLAQCLPHWKALPLAGRDLKLMQNGQVPHHLSQRLIYEQKQANRSASAVGIKVVDGLTGELVSLVEAQPFKGLKIRRIFKFSDADVSV